MLLISKITASPVWIMFPSQRKWLHIGILHQVTREKRTGLTRKQDTTFPAREQDCHTWETMVCPMWKYYWEVALMYYTWCPRKCWPFALVLLLWLLLGTSIFNLHSRVMLWEHDVVALRSSERVGCKQKCSLPHHGLPLFPPLDVWVHTEPTEHTSFFMEREHCEMELWRTFFCSSYVLPYITLNIITMRRTKRSVNLDCGEPYISLLFL